MTKLKVLIVRIVSRAAVALLCGALAAQAGCSSGEKEKNRPRTGADTIQEEVVERISQRVLKEAEESGRLKEVRERRVLRVALPPPEAPFQEVDPELGAAGGFTPALAGEIALILRVKPLVEVLDRVPDLPGYPAGWEEKYDLVALPEGAAGCPAERSVKFFFSGPGKGWKTFCAAGESDSLARAVEYIFSYLNETGIYTRLYGTYVEK